MTHPFTLAMAAILLLVPVVPRSDLGFKSLDNGLRYRCVQVPGTLGVCAVLALRVGSNHDPKGLTGLASTVAHALRSSQSDVPPASRFTVRVLGTTTLLSAVRPSQDLDDLLKRFREVLSGGIALSDDAARRAAGAAALEADDQVNIVPGTALRWMARRSLLASMPAGRQGVGIPAELKRLQPSALVRRYQDLYRPRHAVLSLLGGLPERDMAAAVSAAFEQLPAGDVEVPSPVARDDIGPTPATATSDRVDAPYVTLAVRAPDPGDEAYLAFAVAMEVAAARAALAMRDERGRETFGRFPRFRFDYPAGAHLAFINRRGRNGEGPDRPRAEIATVADSLRDGVTQAEVERAVGQVARRLRLPPYAGATNAALGTARGLYGPASTLVMAEVLGWPGGLDDRIRAVSSRQVGALLRDTLEPGSRAWFEIVRPE